MHAKERGTCSPSINTEINGRDVSIALFAQRIECCRTRGGNGGAGKRTYLVLKFIGGLFDKRRTRGYNIPILNDTDTVCALKGASRVY